MKNLNTMVRVFIGLLFLLVSSFGYAATTLYFVDSDHLGTPQTLTDENQDVVWKVESQTPFGEVAVNEDVDGDGDAVTFNVTFPGQYFDVETGTSYNWHRTYDPLLGRYLQSDPIGLNGGINTYAYVGGNPLMYSDFLGLAPNIAGATSPYYVWQEIRDLSGDNLNHRNVLSELSNNHQTNDNRYFYTDRYGWVDIRHFAEAAYYSNSIGSAMTEYLGWWNEMAQWCSEWGDDYRSGFSPEDLPSNDAGAHFGSHYVGQGLSLQDDFRRWARDVGARSQYSPQAGLNRLPMSDPSYRGGRNRGGSNIDDTP